VIDEIYELPLIETASVLVPGFPTIFIGAVPIKFKLLDPSGPTAPPLFPVMVATVPGGIAVISIISKLLVNGLNLNGIYSLRVSI
jgi:hypothetical protein